MMTTTPQALSRVLPPWVEVAVFAAPRGTYQEGLLAGSQRWSGADLQGRAASWGAGYAASRRALVERLDEMLPVGWSAASELVLVRRWTRRGHSTHRWMRRLVIRGPGVAAMI